MGRRSAGAEDIAWEGFFVESAGAFGVDIFSRSSRAAWHDAHIT